MQIKMKTPWKISLACLGVVVSNAAIWALFIGPMAVIIIPFTTGYVVVVGAPIFMTLRHLGKLNGLNLFITGLLCGTAPVVISNLFSDGLTPEFSDLAKMLGFFGGLGLISAIVFGGIWNLLSREQDRFSWQGKFFRPAPSASRK
jgi:hypothetical protein